MRPEPPSAGSRLLASLMVGAARPFQYRRTVFRLLGVAPATTTSLYFSPHAPPPEFAYRASPLLPEPVVTRPFEPARGVIRSPTLSPIDASPGGTKDVVHTESIDRSTSDRPQGADPAGSSDGGMERATPSDAAPALRVADAPKRPAGTVRASELHSAVAFVEPDVRPDTVSAQPSISLTIPGLTERRSVLAALAARSATMDAPVGDMSVTPARDAIESGPVSLTQPSRATEPQPATEPPRSLLPVARGIHSDVVPTAAPGRAIDVRAVPVTEGVERVLRAARDTRDAQQEPAQLRSTTRPRAVESIEQVRRAVVRRASADALHTERARSSDGSRHSEDAGAAEPSVSAAHASKPTRVITVVAAPPREHSPAPRAFWSSSVLRSSHLRMLR